MKRPALHAILSMSLLAGGLACSAAALASELDWTLSPFAEIDGNLLVVDVPANAPEGMYGATATLDLAPFEGRTLGAKIMAEAGPISTASKSTHGLKFMFHFSGGLSGIEFWPEARRPATPFARRSLEVSDTLSGGSRSPTGTLFLGLQGVSGRIVFDLSTLEINAGEPYWPVTNQTLRCAYLKCSQSFANDNCHKYQLITNDICGQLSQLPIVNNQPLRGVMSPARDMTEDDFQTLAAWGATLLRFQMTNGPKPRPGEAPTAYLARYRAWLDGRLDHLDRDVLPLAVSYGMEVVVDLHTPPGGSDENGFLMFREKAFADEFVALWRDIACRFLGRAGIYGYDLCNEPNQRAPAAFDYWTLQRLAAEAIREIDPETPIVVESNNMDSPLAFSYLCPLDLTNVIYQLHMYEPGDFTHQIPKAGRTFSPETAVSYPAPGKDRAYLERTLAPVREFERRHGAKIYVGEFSASAWAPGADRYIEDCIELFREYGWDWTYHAFREWEGWSVEHEPVAFGTAPDCFAPSSDNPRKRALLDGLSGRIARP